MTAKRSPASSHSRFESARTRIEQQPAAGQLRQALVIKVRLGNAVGQASTLNQLGNLYIDVLQRPEQAAAFSHQAADLFAQAGDTANEGRVRNNLAETLRRLGRLDEARRECRRAIECKGPHSHAALPWTTWSILADIETDADQPEAGRRDPALAEDPALDYELAAEIQLLVETLDIPLAG